MKEEDGDASTDKWEGSFGDGDKDVGRSNCNGENDVFFENFRRRRSGRGTCDMYVAFFLFCLFFSRGIGCVGRGEGEVAGLCLNNVIFILCALVLTIPCFTFETNGLFR